MTTQTKTEEARVVAQKLVNLELDRLAITEEQKQLKDELEILIENGADTTYDLPQGTVFVQESIKYEVSDGLKQEIEAKVKDNTKVSQELITKYFNQDLKPTRRALKEIRNSENPDLSQLVVQKPKSSIKIKVG